MVQTSNASPPPRARLRQGKSIVIGSVEKLAKGRELRCQAAGRRAEVAVYIDGTPTGPTLLFSSPTELRDGEAVDEGEFTEVLDAYYLNSAWHDGEYTCTVRTIDCLRQNKENETLTFKDL